MAQYKIKPGDNGFSIIAKNLGIKDWTQIANLNKGIDTRKLRVGQVINIPDGYGGSKPVQAPTPVVSPTPPNPFDSLKNTALGNDILNGVIDYGQLNPFSNNFNEALVRQTIQQAYNPEFQRVNKIAQDAYDLSKARTGEDYQFQKSGLELDNAQFQRDRNYNFGLAQDRQNQSYADNGTFFGGARQAMLDRMAQEQKNVMDDYAANYNRNLNSLDRSNQRTNQDLDTAYNQNLFDRNRAQSNLVDDLTQREQDVQNQAYIDKKNLYYKNPLYYGTTEGENALKDAMARKMAQQNGQNNGTVPPIKYGLY